MANEEHLARLRAGVDAWNAWRAEPPYIEVNLHGANLFGANLTEADLHGADLHGADLHGANLEGAQLYETIFVDVDLSATKGLDACRHIGPSVLDHRTLQQSGHLPLTFLRGCGLPDRLIDYLPSILQQANQFYSCFISYSHADISFARRLHDQLQRRGIRCWLDEDQLLPGDDIYEQVDRGVQSWDLVARIGSDCRRGRDQRKQRLRSRPEAICRAVQASRQASSSYSEAAVPG